MQATLPISASQSGHYEYKRSAFSSSVNGLTNQIQNLTLSSNKTKKVTAETQRYWQNLKTVRLKPLRMRQISKEPANYSFAIRCVSLKETEIQETFLTVLAKNFPHLEGLQMPFIADCEEHLHKLSTMFPHLKELHITQFPRQLFMEKMMSLKDYFKGCRLIISLI